MADRLHVVVHGRVQGVGFRYAAYRQAQHLGLRGWVRNRADGSVEAEFDGRREDLDAFLRWCSEGPPLARVSSVESAWRQSESEYVTVEIR